MYNLSMEGIEPHELNIYDQLLKLSSKQADTIRGIWRNEAVISANKLKISSRSINYYESIGLIKDPRSDDKKGWRKFTYVEAVYLLIVRELRHYGIDTDFIKTFYDSFIKNDDEFFTNALLLAHLGYKITIVIEPNKTESILTAKELYNREHGVDYDSYSSEIRLNLAYFAYEAEGLIKHGGLTGEIAAWFRNELDDEALKSLRHDWNKQENMLVDRFRQLKPGESLAVKYANNGDIYTTYEKPVKITEDLGQSLADVAGDYGETTIKMSGGKAVKSTVKKSTKL